MMEAACLINHKLPYNENLSPPQSWWCLVLGRPAWPFSRFGLNKS
jgi:hypothetical protein